MVGVVQTFNNEAAAERLVKNLEEDSKRFYGIMESKVNDYRKDNSFQGRDQQPS